MESVKDEQERTWRLANELQPREIPICDGSRMAGGLVGSSERPKRWLSKLVAAEAEIKGGVASTDQLPPVLFPSLSI